MNEIIKNIEAAQLKETVPSFNPAITIHHLILSDAGTAE